LFFLLFAIQSWAHRFEAPKTGFQKMSFSKHSSQCANVFISDPYLMNIRQTLLQQHLKFWVEKERYGQDKVDQNIEIENSLPVDRTTYMTFKNGDDSTLVRIFDGSLRDGASSAFPMERKSMGIEIPRNTHVYEIGLLTASENVAQGADAVVQSIAAHFDKTVNSGKYQSLGRFEIEGTHVVYVLAKALQARMYAKYGFHAEKLNDEYRILRIDIRDLIEKNIGRRPSPRRVNETDFWDPQNEKLSWEVRLWYAEFADREQRLQEVNFDPLQAKSLYPKISSEAEKRIYRDPNPAHWATPGKDIFWLLTVRTQYSDNSVYRPVNFSLIQKARLIAAQQLKADLEKEGQQPSAYLQNIEAYDSYYSTVKAPHQVYVRSVIGSGPFRVVRKVPLPGTDATPEQTRQFNLERRMKLKPQLESLGLQVDLE